MEIEPWIRTILDSLLAVLSPFVTIFKQINLTLGQEAKPCLSFPFLFLFCLALRTTIYIHMQKKKKFELNKAIPNH